MSESLIDENEHRRLNYSIDDNIDSEELANACRRLGLSGPLEPLLRDLRENHSRSSLKDTSLSPRKQSLKYDKKANKQVKSSYGQESWGRDSGARDLSPELHRHPTSSGTDSQFTENETGTGTSSMLDLASKLQVAALSALKTEVLELSARLQHSERERDTIQRQLNDALEEKERSQRRLESIGSAHESRITEMHCVIVELSKKLKVRQDNAIMEEQEPEGSVSELSFQEGSIYNSENECINYDPESQTEPLDIKLDQRDATKSESPCSLPPPVNTTQIQALQEEILHLRAQVALLQSQLAVNIGNTKDDNVNDIENCRRSSPGEEEKSVDLTDEMYETTIGDFTREKDIGSLDDNELGPEFVRPSTAKYIKTSNIMLPQQTRGISPVVQLLGSLSAVNKQQAKCKSDMPIAKMAERVKLRRVMEDQHISGSDLLNTGICTTVIAEHLVSDLLKPEQSVGNDSVEIAELQSEIHRIQRRFEHLRIKKSVLSFALDESKAHCDQLYLLCGKYESNAIALHQALNYSDRAIEAYDVMLALLESKLDILEDEPTALDSRKSAEDVAKLLINRLECENNLQENSLGPWHDAVIIPNNKENNSPWSKRDDLQLRNHVSILKGKRAAIQNTVVQLESPFNIVVEHNNRNNGKSPSENSQICKRNDPDFRDDNNRRMDLETAVLMEEVMRLREEACDLRHRAEQVDRDKLSVEQRFSVLQEAFIHLQAQLAESEAVIAIANKDRSSYSEAEHAVGIERELVEALARESRLKARLQDLAGSLEIAARSSEEKYAQVQNTVSELKQANVSLTQSLDRCKRKYQGRLRRLEQQLLDVSINNKTNLLTQQNLTSPHSPHQHHLHKVQQQQQPVVIPETTL